MSKLNAPIQIGRWWFVPAGIALLIVGNHYLNQQQLPILAALALIAGILLVVVDVRRSAWVLGRLPARTPDGTVDRNRRLLCIGIALAAGVLAWVWVSGNTFRTSGVIAWIVAVAAWMLAWWPSRPGGWRNISLTVPKWLTTRSVLTVALVLVAIAIGAFFRFYRIGSTPSNPTSDHAEKLLDVTDVLNGLRPIFFERNTGREPTQFYLTAGLIRMFDLPATFTTLKIGTAFIGTLAILFVYLMASEYAGRVVGISAAFLLAVSTWGVEISRAGLRFPYALVSCAAVLWLLLRWMRTRHRGDALLCGLAVGIGLYGYSPFRVVVPAVCLGLAIAVIASENRAMRVRAVIDGLLLGATAAVFFIPLGRYSYERPEMFWERSSSRMTDGEVSGGAISQFIDKFPVFLRNNWNALIGPNWRGDSTFVNAVSYVPMMDLISGALLLAGVAAIFTHIVKSRDDRSIFLVLSVPFLLLGSTLSIAFPWENPSVNREGPVLPVVMTIAALPIALMALRLVERFGQATGTVIAAYASTVLIAVAAAQSYQQYFHEFDRQTRLIVSNTPAITSAIRGGATVGVDMDDIYVLDWPDWFDIRNVGFDLGNIDWAFSHNISMESPLPSRTDGQPMLFLLNASDSDRLEELQRIYPESVVSTYATEIDSKSFVTVWIPPE